MLVADPTLAKILGLAIQCWMYWALTSSANPTTLQIHSPGFTGCFHMMLDVTPPPTLFIQKKDKTYFNPPPPSIIVMKN